VVINSEKKTKICSYCNKEVKNLGFHISNLHPNVFSKIDDTPNTEKVLTDNSTNITTTLKPSQLSINEMIKDKLDTMLNIRIIEMLSKNASLSEIQQVLNPTPKTTIEELKQYHDLVYSDNKNNGVNLNVGENSSGWLELATNALPIISQMLPQKQKELKQDDELRRSEERSLRILKPISEEVTGNREESRKFSEESRIIIPTKQQDNKEL